jgi:hypothetical protein
MKLAALVTTILLGTTSMAAAESSLSASASFRVSFGAPATSLVVRDHRVEAPHRIPAPVSAWVPVGSVARGRLTLANDRLRAGTFDRLLLASNGRVYVEKVYIQFANGQFQMERPHRYLRDLEIDLAGQDRSIRRVIVYLGNGSARDAIHVYGRDDRFAERPPAGIAGMAKLGQVVDGVQTLRLGGEDLDRLAFVANGPVTIDKVVIRYGQKNDHVIQIDRTLTGRSAPITVALPRTDRGIVAIMVFSDATPGTELSLFGR